MNRNEGYTLSNSYGLMGPVGVASTDAAAFFAWGDSRRGTVQTPTEDWYFTSVVYEADEAGAGVSGSTDSNNVEYFVLGSVVMLGLVGVVLLLVSRRMRPAAARSPGGGTPAATS